MDIVETIHLSIKSILSNRLRSFLTVLGIVIGVSSVILLISLVSGLKTFITDQINSLGSNVIYVIPGKIGGARGPGGIQTNKLTLQDANILKSRLEKGIEVSAGIQRTSTVKYLSNESKDVTVAGAWPNYSEIIKSVKVVQGRMFTNAEETAAKRVVVIGATIKKNLFNNNNPLGKYIEIDNSKYQVVGVMSERGSNFGLDLDNFVIIPLSSAQRQFKDDRIHSIFIAARNNEEVKEVQKEVEKILLRRLSEDDFTVQTQEQTLSTISQITDILTVALGGIAGISLIVGGIGIMNIMLVTVTERTREIGLRKALGARPKDIRNQFLIEALTLSGLGGIIGIIIGFLLSLLIGRFITTLIPLWSVLLSFGFSILVGVLFGVAPAIRASKLDPIQALRYE